MKTLSFCSLLFLISVSANAKVIYAPKDQPRQASRVLQKQAQQKVEGAVKAHVAAPQSLIVQFSGVTSKEDQKKLAQTLISATKGQVTLATPAEFKNPESPCKTGTCAIVSPAQISTQ